MKIAILWDGQLWALTALAAQKMWHKTKIFWAIWEKAPASQVSDFEKIDYNDINNIVKKFLEWWTDVVTSEWENIPVNLLQAIERRWVNVFPNSKIMGTIQDRRTEKQAIQKAWEQVVNYIINLKSKKDIEKAFNKLGEGILKTARNGYDSKWQYKILSLQDIENINIDFYNMDYIYEQKEDFEYEISVIVARNKNWEVLIYEPTHNIHENGILRKSTIPAQNSNIAINANIIKKSKSIAKNIAEQMWVIWLLCIEMFVLKDWTIKVNELAPRPHNSWHHTIESYNISQYEALIKAITWTTFWELKLIRKSVLTNLLWNEIKTMPKRKKDKWFCIIKEWNIIWYDYGKDKDLPDSNLPKWRKMWHKVEIF